MEGVAAVVRNHRMGPVAVVRAYASTKAPASAGMSDMTSLQNGMWSNNEVRSHPYLIAA